MKNMGGREDGCCWVLNWDTGKRVFVIFILHSYFRFRQVQTNYKEDEPVRCTLPIDMEIN